MDYTPHPAQLREEFPRVVQRGEDLCIQATQHDCGGGGGQGHDEYCGQEHQDEKSRVVQHPPTLD